MKLRIYLSIALLCFLFSSCIIDIVDGHVFGPKYTRVIFPTYVNARLYTYSHNLINAQIVLPRSKTKKIKCRTDSGMIKYPIDSIDYLYGWHKMAKESKAIKLVNSHVILIKTNGKPGETQCPTKKYWIVRKYISKYLEVFTTADEFCFFEDGSSVALNNKKSNVAYNWYFFKRKEEDLPTGILPSIWGAKDNAKMFAYYGQNYFSDCPPLVDKIRNREFSKNNIEELLKFYDNWKTAGN